MKYSYWSIYETNEKGEKRRIYTFDNETSAHELVELIIKNDFLPTSIVVEHHETTT